MKRSPDNIPEPRLLKKVNEFPSSPGVYLMKDQGGQIIYVGKAKNLRARIRQYFGSGDERPHVRFLMRRLADVDFLLTHNETEALLLENSLIKKHKPRYNVFLRDDKTYQGVKLTVQQDFPRLITTRRVKKDGALYYGPFASADSLYQVKEFIDQYFQLRTCTDHDFNTRTRPCLEYQIKRCLAPCVGYVSKEQYAKQIETVRLFLEGRNKDLQRLVREKMNRAASEENFEEAARLRDLLASMDSVLEGQKVTRLSFAFLDVIAFMRQGERVGVAVLMIREGKLIDSRYYVFKSLEEDEEFLQNFLAQYYTENSFIPQEIVIPFSLAGTELMADVLSQRAGRRVTVRYPRKGDKRDLLRLAEQNLASHFAHAGRREENIRISLKRLRERLHLRRIPFRMECYDVSNISGRDAVGSLVTFVNGQAHKDGYRRFKIKTCDTPNDYAMLKEVLSRRFRRTEGRWRLPDLIVVDGGRGQLAQAMTVLDELGITDRDVVAIAKGKGPGARASGLWKEKKEEAIYIPGRKNPVILKRGSGELMLLQRLRDESHRFAITYHRLLREKKGSRSFLDAIPGIGKKRKAALIKKFGSPKKVGEAPVAALMAVAGITREIAEQIHSSQGREVAT